MSDSDKKDKNVDTNAGPNVGSVSGIADTSINLVSHLGEGYPAVVMQGAQSSSARAYAKSIRDKMKNKQAVTFEQKDWLDIYEQAISGDMDESTKITLERTRTKPPQPVDPNVQIYQIEVAAQTRATAIIQQESRENRAFFSDLLGKVLTDKKDTISVLSKFYVDNNQTVEKAYSGSTDKLGKAFSALSDLTIELTKGVTVTISGVNSLLKMQSNEVLEFVEKNRDKPGVVDQFIPIAPLLAAVLYSTLKLPMPAEVSKALEDLKKTA